MTTSKTLRFNFAMKLNGAECADLGERFPISSSMQIRYFDIYFVSKLDVYTIENEASKSYVEIGGREVSEVNDSLLPP